jgi:5-methylcytosine-specific restriction protein A
VSPLRVCLAPGCPELTSERYCADHTRERDQRRGTATQRGYDARWRRRRLAYLREHPLCEHCLANGRATPATQVDHVVPLRSGGADAPSNYQALCASCHSRKTVREDGGFGRG